MSNPTAPSYRDPELNRAVKVLRAAIRTGQGTQRALEKVEERLKYVLRVVDQWDHHHAAHAEKLIRLGQFETANGVASLVFDAGMKADLYARSPIGMDTGAEDRMADALDQDREVLV